MKRAVIFVIITCLISWAFAGISFTLVDISKGMGFKILGMVYMLFPAIVAFILQKFIYKEPLKKEFKISFKFNKWFIIAIITPLIITILSILIDLIYPNVHFSWEADGYFELLAGQISEEQIIEMKKQMFFISKYFFPVIIIITALFAGSTINAVFAFGEELGWRGFMLHYLRKYSFAKVCILTGIIWGFWHFPLILQGHNYPAHPVIGVFMMVIFCILFSFITTYIVIKSNSVITAALIHGNLNAIAGTNIVYLVGGNDLMNGVTGVSGFIAMIIIIILLFIYDKYISKENIFTNPVEYHYNRHKNL